MKAMLVDENRNLVWSDVDAPVMKEDELLVDIQAAALNRADLLQRRGTYPSPPGCPPWMGLEVSGIVRDIGPVAAGESDWRIGDRVCALLGGGGYAQQVAVRHDMAMPIPAGLSMEEAAALPEAAATSYLNLFIEGHLEAGDTVYIAAGASGLASMGIPMARALGVRVVTSVLTEEIAQSIRHLNADIVVNTSREKLADVARRLEEEGRPINAAMDCLSGEMLGETLPYMARGGYWIVISTLAGTTTNVSLRPLLTKGLHLVGSMLRSRAPEMKARILRELVERVWPHIESGAIRPSIHRTLPIAEAEEAHAILERSENVGKVVLSLHEPD
jgi:NADPH2:quinone reductase